MNLKCRIKYGGFRPIIREAAIKAGLTKESYRNAPQSTMPWVFLLDVADSAKDLAGGGVVASHVIYADERSYDAKEVGIEEFLSAIENFVPPTPPFTIAGHKTTFSPEGMKVGCTFVSKAELEEAYKRFKAQEKPLADQFLEAIAEVKASTPQGTGCGAASVEAIAKLDKLSTSNGGPQIAHGCYYSGQYSLGTDFNEWLRSEFGSAVASAWDESCTWSRSCGTCK